MRVPQVDEHLMISGNFATSFRGCFIRCTQQPIAVVLCMHALGIACHGRDVFVKRRSAPVAAVAAGQVTLCMPGLVQPLLCTLDLTELRNVFLCVGQLFQLREFPFLRQKMQTNV